MKDKIISKASQDFLQKGVRNMSVQNLVDSLGISTKTFYKYFKNKEELLEEVLILHYNQQFKLIQEYSREQNPVFVLLNVWMKAFQVDTDVNNKFYSDIHNYYSELERRVESKVSNTFWLEFQRLIQAGINEGLFLKNILPEVVMESIAVLYGTAVRTDQYVKFQISADQSFLNTVALVIRGICTPKGLVFFDNYFEAHQK
ncbi:TetR/AcrR family transcriptional regulator [uncultured Draconibacterium sp.]|uniref:TetR/AcrR family transcriptional regulator n=1 Tax=uncultured Draconibacterium sp. TaxID=1573823 RepID=UPI002AA8EDF7|nr:TetR/AcrR family transcriptional regulator [uncultured Draconibacterium sp.]